MPFDASEPDPEMGVPHSETDDVDMSRLDHSEADRTPGAIEPGSIHTAGSAVTQMGASSVPSGPR